MWSCHLEPCLFFLNLRVRKVVVGKSGRDRLSVDEGVFPSASSTHGSSPIGQECPMLFFSFFLGPLFLHGFRWLFFGFFACVLALAHGCAPCVVNGAAFLWCRLEANGSEPVGKSIDGVVGKVGTYR